MERSFRRNKDRRDSVTAKVCRLLEIEAGTETILCEGQSEVTRRITEIIGLNMDDFTRSVVLPQGEFAQFLKLKDSERDQMLERVFSLAEYGSKLTEKVKAERELLSSELDQVNGILQGLGDISPEKIAQTREELTSKKAEQQTISQEYLRVEQAYENAAAVWNLQRELEQAGKDQGLLLQSQNEIDLRRTLLKKAEAAEAIRPYFDACRQAETTLAQSRELFLQSVTTFESANQEYQKLVAEKANIEKEYQEKQPELIVRKTRLESLLNDEAELGVKENQHLELRQRTKELDESLQNLRNRLQNGDEYKAKKGLEIKQLESEIEALSMDSSLRGQVLAGAVLEQEYENSQTEFNQLQQEIQTETGDRNRLENDLRNLEAARNNVITNLTLLQAQFEGHQQSKPGDLAIFTEKSESFVKLERALTDLIRIQAEIRLEQEEQTRMETGLQLKECRITECSQACATCQQKIDHLELAKNQLQTELKKLDEETYAAKIAEELREGAPCPVCGSPHHPQPARRSDPTEFTMKQKEQAEVEQLLTAAREELKQAERELTQIRTAQETEFNQLQKMREKTTAKETEQASFLQLLPQEWREEGTEELQSRIRREKQNLESFQQAMTGWEKQNDQLKKDLERLQEAAKQHDSSFNHFQGQLTIRAGNLAKLNAGFETKQPLLREKQAQYEALQQTLGITGVSFRERQKQLLEADKQTQDLRKNADFSGPGA